MDMGDLFQCGGTLGNALGLLNYFLSVLFNDLFLLFNDLGEFFDSLLKLVLSLLLLLLFPIFDLFVDFLGSLGSDLDVDILSLLLNFLGFFLEFLDGLLNIDDLGVDFGVLFLFSLKLGGAGLDGGLQSFDLRGDACDLVLDLGLLLFLLGADDLLLKLINLLLLLGNSSLGSLDLTLMSHNLVSDYLPLSCQLLSLLLCSLFSLVSGVFVSDRVLFDLDRPVFVVVVLSTSANSVDASSLNLLVLLERVVILSFSSSVCCVVSLPGGVDCGDGCSDVGDLSGYFSDVLLVLLNLRLNGINFLFNGLLLLLLDSLESLSHRLESRFQVLFLSLVSGESLLLLVELSGPCGDFFFVLLFLLSVFDFFGFEFSFLLFVLVFLLHNISCLNSFLDIGNGFFLSSSSFAFSFLNLRGHLGNHQSRVSDLGLKLSFLLGLSLDSFLGLLDLGGDARKFLLESLDLSSFCSNVDLGRDVLFFCSEFGDLFFLCGN